MKLSDDLIALIGSRIKKTRDAVVFSSTCMTAARMQWAGDVIVTPRWIDAFPPSRPQVAHTLLFKRAATYDIEKYENIRRHIQRLRFQCCKVPFDLLAPLAQRMPKLRHLHIHRLVSRDQHAPNLAILCDIPSLETLDITFSQTSATWGVIPVTPSNLSRRLHTLRLRLAEVIWIENEGWPGTLRHLELETTDGVLIPSVPTSVCTVRVTSPNIQTDDENLFEEDARYENLRDVFVKTRGAFGFSWLEHAPNIECVSVCSDTIIVDDSFGYAKRAKRIELETRWYFVTGFLHFATLERLRGIDNLILRKEGGKAMHLDKLI